MSESPEAAGKQPSIILRAAVILIPLFLFFSALAWARPTEPPLPVLRTLPDFKFTERSGRPIGLSDLAGHPWVATFIFTRCSGPCPVLCSRLSDLQAAIPAEWGVKLVTFTLDPNHDTPEVLQAFARQWGADPQRWYFLTGEQEALHKLSREHFMLAASIEKDPVQPAPEGTIVHSERLILVDGQGRIRAQYAGSEDQSVARIRQDLDRLRREAQ